MGVVNVTPNSFSDGGKAFHREGLLNSLKDLIPYCDILDFGAESTAPMNDSVGAKEERHRLSDLLMTLKESKILSEYSGSISLDSFRSENALWFFENLKREGIGSENRYIWNDISGKLDHSVRSFLKNFPQSYYVFCHNLSPERNLAGRHMDSIFDGNLNKLIPHLSEFFQEISGLQEKGRVILDPCFGFSKTYEQNTYLLSQWADLVDSYPDQAMVFGISKKSFLRRWWQENMPDSADISKSELLKKSESLHLLWLNDALSRGREKGLQKLILRVHDPKLAILAKQFAASY